MVIFDAAIKDFEIKPCYRRYNILTAKSNHLKYHGDVILIFIGVKKVRSCWTRTPTSVIQDLSLSTVHEVLYIYIYIYIYIYSDAEKHPVSVIVFGAVPSNFPRR